MHKFMLILDDLHTQLPLLSKLNFPAWAHKLILCLLVGIAAMLITRMLKKFIQHILLHDNNNIPSVTIIINLMRSVIWGLALAFVMEPVFGIKPTALLTALGVGGLALSLGVKDTVANTVAGIQIILGKLLTPGNHIHIGNYTGTVQDINWRHTTVQGRLGEEISIPNSVLNTQTLIKIPDSLEEFTVLPLMLRHGVDLEHLSKELIQLSYEVASESLADKNETPVSLKITGFNQFGIQAELWLNVKAGKSKAGTKDLIARALNNSHCASCLAQLKDEV